MINGAHVIVYSKKAEADRAFLRDVLSLDGIDVGEGWLIFGLPPAEIAIHPSDTNDEHEIYFMCDDIEAFISAMKRRRIKCTSVSNQGWGLLTSVSLPGGGKLGVYQPRHARPKPMAVRQSAVGQSARSAAAAHETVRRSKPRKAAKRTGKRPARKSARTRSR